MWWKRTAMMIALLAWMVTGCSAGASTAPDNHEKKTTKVFHLYAADVNQELAPGKTLYSWGFGLWDPKKNQPASPATIPGPELRVTEGDHVKVIFHNRQKEPHTIHFHGVDNSFQGDGTPGVSQKEVEQNGTYTYEFDALAPGTYFYHCHVEPDRHPEMGLYGAFIVEPKKKPHYDGEFVWMLGERDPKLSLAEGTEAGKYVGTEAEHEHLDGDYDTVDRKPKFFTINGKIDPAIPPVQVKKGGKYLIRLINAGSDVHTIHTHGHHFQVIASDGRPLPKPVTKDSITIGPGERYDLVLTANNPGIWPIHCHIGPHSTHGMHMLMVYKGYENRLQMHESHLSTILHELAEIKEFYHEKNVDKIKVELSELSTHYDQVRGILAQKDAQLANDIQQTGQAIAHQLTSPSPNFEQLGKLITQLENQLNQAQEKLGEEAAH
jgi:FtsP/CotA-like multicopper oxidase with cupredoxin domain